MSYKKDRDDNIVLKKDAEGFWHPVKEDGTMSDIKGSTKEKAMNALHAYEAKKHSNNNGDSNE